MFSVGSSGVVAAILLQVISGVVAGAEAQPRVVSAKSSSQGPFASIPSFPLKVIATLPGVLGQEVFVGDSDHDGQFEILAMGRNSQGDCCFYQIFEYLGRNEYSSYVGEQLHPTGLDDLDQDGRAEIIGQVGDHIVVYEAVDSSSYPTQLIWSSPSVSTTLGSFAFGDTDRDGHRELIYGMPGSGIVYVFESTGDNTFQTHSFFPGSGGTGVFVADMDQDGLQEIICAKGSARRLKFFESPANDTWIEVANLPTRPTPGHIAGGHDVDGDGKPDLFVGGAGATPDSTGYAYTTTVYEPVCDNQYAAVDSFYVADGSSGALLNALGDLDGLGIEEYVVDTSSGLWIFRPTSPRNWELVGQVLDPDGGIHFHVTAADVNQNGRSELIWPSALNTLVLEYSSGISDTPVFGDANILRLSVSPNPCQGLAIIRVPGAELLRGQLAVFDVRGRLVERLPVAPDVRGDHLWQTRSLNAGTYFLQLETNDRTPVAKGRAVITRK